MKCSQSSVSRIVTDALSRPPALRRRPGSKPSRLRIEAVRLAPCLMMAAERLLESNMSIDKVVILLRLDANQEKILRMKYGK